MELDAIGLGDAYELIKAIPEKSIDLVLTDPPYLYDKKTKWFVSTPIKSALPIKDEVTRDNLKDGVTEEMWEEWLRVCKKPNVFAFCNKWQVLPMLEFFVGRHGLNFEILVWHKTNPVPLANGSYVHDKEFCLNFWQSGSPHSITSIRLGRTVYDFPTNQKDKKLYLHPTIKPLEMVKGLVEIGSRAGGVVLDPFMGSGTTAVACQALGRHFVGFEQNPKWRQVALDRLAGHDQKELAETADGMRQGFLF